jgi:hypothetical protein
VRRCLAIQHTTTRPLPAHDFLPAAADTCALPAMQAQHNGCCNSMQCCVTAACCASNCLLQPAACDAVSIAACVVSTTGHTPQQQQQPSPTHVPAPSCWMSLGMPSVKPLAKPGRVCTATCAKTQQQHRQRHETTHQLSCLMATPILRSATAEIE